jgi:hypothetical protein
MLLCAFLIDRIIASVLFVASYIRAASDKSKKGEKSRKELRKTFVYFFLSGSLAVAAMSVLKGLRLDLSAFPGGSELSPVITWLVLVAGADRVSAFAGVAAAPAPAAETEGVEVQVSGTLRIDPETARKIEQAAGE